MSNSSDKPAPTYDIGYRRPPKGRRFKPGQSGNPTGLPKPKESSEAAFEELLRELVQVNDKGRQRRIPASKVILRQLRTAAMRGDLATAKFLLSQVPKDNKPEDPYDLTLLSDEEVEQLERILRKAQKS